MTTSFCYQQTILRELSDAAELLVSNVRLHLNLYDEFGRSAKIVGEAKMAKI